MLQKCLKVNMDLKGWSFVEGLRDGESRVERGRNGLHPVAFDQESAGKELNLFDPYLICIDARESEQRKIEASRR